MKTIRYDEKVLGNSYQDPQKCSSFLTKSCHVQECHSQHKIVKEKVTCMIASGWYITRSHCFVRILYETFEYRIVAGLEFKCRMNSQNPHSRLLCNLFRFLGLSTPHIGLSLREDEADLYFSPYNIISKYRALPQFVLNSKTVTESNLVRQQMGKGDPQATEVQAPEKTGCGERGARSHRDLPYTFQSPLNQAEEV